jgi:hypothetical protein
MDSGLRGISIVCQLAEIDSENFVLGLSKALQENPKNLTAARSLIWFYIRNGNYEDAKRIYASIELHWSKYNEIFIEHIRTLIVQGSIKEATELFANSKKFFSQAGLGSYSAQLASEHGPANTGAISQVMMHGAVALRNAMFAQGSESRIKASERAAFWSFADLVSKAKTIALIGNAPTLKGQGKGNAIDAHDLVIRCNFPTIKGYQADVGSRTDAMMFNESLRDRLNRLRGESDYFSRTLAIGVHPEQDFGLPTHTSYEDAQGVGTIPPVLRRFISDICYSRSTTGLMSINLLVFVFNRKISIFGFDFFSDVNRPHYFGNQVGAYLGHELQYERWFVETFCPKDFLI